MKRLVAILACLLAVARTEHTCRDGCDYGNTLGGVDLSHLKGVWETVYYSRSEGAIEDNEATFFNISLCGGITGQWQPRQCTDSPTSVCMHSSDNAVFSLADTPSCDVTYDSSKRHVQFIYNYSSSAEATFHKGNVTITLICGQHLGVPEVVYGDPHSGNIQIIWVTSAVCTQERQPIHESKCYTIGSNSAAGIDAETYDLSYLIKSEGYKLKTDGLPHAEFTLSLCRPLDVPGNCNGSMFCLSNGSFLSNNAPFPLAYISDSSSLQLRNNLLYIEYFSKDTPDVCGENAKDGASKVHRKIEIHFMCPKDNEIIGPKITFIDGKGCLCTIQWYTSYACGMSAIESTSCIIKDHLTKQTKFDLTELGKNLNTALVTGEDADRYSYHFSVCSGRGVDIGHCPRDTGGSIVRVSQEYDTTCHSLGSDPGKLKYADGALTMTYSYGDHCHTNFARTSIINFFCPKDVKDLPANTTSHLRFVEEDNCLYTFEWVTPLACPKEEVEDASDCGFQLDKVSYSLAQLIPESDTNWLVVGGSKSFNTSCYMVSPCGGLVVSGEGYRIGSEFCLAQKAPTTCDGFSVCQVFYNGTGRPLGYFDVTDSSSINTVSDGVFLLNSTKLGGVCPGRKDRAYSTMTYVCKPGALVDPPVLIANYYDCVVEFQWQTAVACPLAHYHGESNNCKIKDTRLNYEYDLSSLNLDSAVYSHYTKPFNYTLNVCGEVECGDGKQVGMCQHDGDKFRNVGMFNSTLEYENGILRAIYTEGDKCHNGQSRNTTIVFQCDHSHVSGLVIDDVTEVHCDYEVTALTNLACPPNYRAVECAFQDKHGRQYDLSQLAKEEFNWEASGTESNNVTYLINVCRPLNKASGCSPTSAVCEYALPLNGSGSEHKKFLHNLGHASTGHFKVSDNGSVTLTYHFDPPAGSGGCQRLVNIAFECDKDAELDAPPRFLSGGDSQSSCQYYFSWRTRAACPIASETVENSCKVTDETSSYTYDLTPLRSTARDYNLTGSDGNVYWINLCGALVDSKSCPKDSAGCQKPKGSSSSFSLGKSNTEKLKYIDGSIVLTYEGGDVCHHNNRPRIMEVTFQCDNENGSIGRPYFREENECLYRFLWPTVLACKPKTIDCIAEGGKYSLRPLFIFNRNWHIQNSNVYNDRELYISVCQPLDVSKFKNASCPDGSAACEVYRNGTGRGLGGVYSDLKVVSEGLISLTYSNGKRCPNGDIGKVVTLFRCNRQARIGTPRIVAVTDNCEYEMEWESSYACPVTPTVTANCTILDPVTNAVVNLRKVLKRMFFSVNLDHFVYNVSVCGQTIKCGGNNSLPHSGCQAELEGEKRQFSIGLLNESSLELIDGKLRLTYDHGEKCNHVNVHRKTVINFECDRTDPLGTLQFKEENNCEYAFTYSVNLDIICHQAAPKIDCSVPNFDLSPIANIPYLRQPVKLQSKGLLARYAVAMISICHPLNHSKLMARNCTPGQAACLSGNGVTLDLGQPTDPPVAMTAGEGVVLTYKNGGPCEGGKSRSAVIRIVCDTDVGLLSTLSFIGDPPSEKTCEYVFEVKSKSACWLNHTTAESTPTATTGSTNSGTTSSGTSATESPTNPTNINSLSPTLCSITDPAFTKTITFESIDKATGYTTSSSGHDYTIRLCGPLPDKICGTNAAICTGNSRLVSAEHHIVAMSSTSVGFHYPWGSKCKSQNRNDTALILVHCGSQTLLSHTGYYSELCEHRFSLSSPSMCFSDATTFVECMAQPNVSVEYDLSSLMGQTYKGIVLSKPGDTSPYDIDAVGTFNLSVCRSLNPLTEAGDKCDPGNALCVKSIKGGYIGLGHMKTAPTVSPEGHVILLYEGGSTCGEKDGSKYSAKIHLICNRIMGAPVLMKRPAECMYELEWDSLLACKSHYDKSEAVHCLFNNTITGMEMDLQPLVNLTATTTVDGIRYDATACGKVVKTSGSKKTILGTYSGSFNLFSAQGVKLDYSGSNKDKCNADYPYSSTVIMECSRGTDGVGKLVYNKEISNKCHSYFTWWTMYACASTELSCSTELDGKFYDFSELHHSHYWSVADKKDRKFKINICGPITNLPTHSTGCSSGAALCLQLNNYQQKFLEIAQTDTQAISEVGQGDSRKIMLQYSGVTPTSQRNDTSCTAYHVKIVMNCGPVSSKPMELIESKDCIYTFQWSTSLACPERVISGDNTVSECTDQIPKDKAKNSYIFYPNKLKRTEDTEMTNNYYAVSEDVHRFFINICAPVRPQHLYDLSGCGSNSAVCMLVGGHATSLVSADKVVFSYEDRWLEILMSEGSNRVIVRVECIHDRLFDTTGFHPIGAEHLEFEYNSTTKGVTTYYFSMKTLVGCETTGYEGTTEPTTAPTTVTTASTSNKEGHKNKKKGGAGAAVAIVIIVILLSLAIMSLFLLLKNERRRSMVFEKAQRIFGQPNKPISIDSEMEHLIPMESGDESGKEKDDSSSSEEEHAAISTSGEDEELMDL